MSSYYAESLSGRRLQRCYEVASPRVRQYLEAELRYVLEQLGPRDFVLELGCGYGRVVFRLAEVAQLVVGVDTAEESLALARELARESIRCQFLAMDAVDLHFPEGEFDAVVCIQNGICAFGVDQERLLREALRVTREGGLVLLSTYAAGFWPHRLEWFEAQAAEGLLGRVDHDASGDGVIVCEDGFRAGQLNPDQFENLCARLEVSPEMIEVDGSSLFCRILKER
jgi:2-polyprenyl-6-hydroxyphenyl methylase/3-demethylubiquinone-9 3-methyltransferase